LYQQVSVRWGWQLEQALDQMAGEIHTSTLGLRLP
jgi:hypothetical protein